MYLLSSDSTRVLIFFLLTWHLYSARHLYSAFQLCILSEVRLLNFLRLTYTFYRYIHPPEATPTSPGSTRADDESSGSWCHADDGFVLRKAIPKKTHEKTLEVGELSCFWAPNVFFWWKFKLSSFLDYFDFHFYSSINKFWSRYGFMFTQMCFDIQTVLRRLKDGWHPKT